MLLLIIYIEGELTKTNLKEKKALSYRYIYEERNPW